MNSPVDPVRQIQPSVHPQRSEIMRSNRLCLPRPLKHEQLRQDRHRLQINGESPKHFCWCPSIGENEGEQNARDEEVFESEGVETWIRGGSETELHEVEGVDGGGDEEEFHEGVVEGDVGACEEVDVAGEEDEDVKGLGFEGDTLRVREWEGEGEGQQMILRGEVL